MADEQETIAPDELDIPAIEEEQDPTTNDNLAEENPEESQPEGEEQQAPIEYAEIERNGKRYQVPKELEGEFMMQADYTKKTQATSAREKELDAREQRISQQSQFNEDELNERAALKNVTDQLKQYQTVNWDAEEEADPMNAQRHFRNFQLLKEQHARLTGNLQQRQEFRTREAQQETAKRIEETRNFAQKEIPGWSPEMDGKILDFTQQMGIDKAALQQAMNPKVYKILHRAWVGEQALLKQATALKPQANTAPLKPLATVGSKAPVSKDISEMSMDEYAAHRRRQMANKR